MLANKAELALFAVNEQGKPQHGTRFEAQFAMRPDAQQRLVDNGVRFNPRITLAPGRYQLRIGVREAASRKLGSVFYDVAVPDFTKEPLMLSGLLLTTASSQKAVAALRDTTLEKTLLTPATSRREFSQSDTLSLLAEIYDNNSSQQPRQIDASVRLVAEDGREIFAARDSIQNGSARNWTAYGYARDIPLKDVPPGRYLLRVDAQLRGGSAKPVSAETLISIR